MLHISRISRWCLFVVVPAVCLTASQRGGGQEAKDGMAFEAAVAGAAAAEKVKDPATKPTVAEVRAKYAKYPSKVLKIAEPAEVKFVAYYKDGGSIHWLLVDAAGKEHSFRTYKSPSATFYYTNRPKDEKGRPLDEGGEEQKELYGLWLRWIAKNIPNADAFLADKELPKTTHDAAGLALSFRALERRIVVTVEKGSYLD